MPLTSVAKKDRAALKKEKYLLTIEANAKQASLGRSKPLDKHLISRPPVSGPMEWHFKSSR